VLYEAIKTNNANDLSLTIKGYAINKGLSDFIFQDLDAKK
jgi:NAD(P)H-flavin reductase